jgi:hypothetical protein
MCAVAERLALRQATAAEAEQPAVRKSIAGFVKDFEIPDDMNGAVVENGDLCRTQLASP